MLILMAASPAQHCVLSCRHGAEEKQNDHHARPLPLGSASSDWAAVAGGHSGREKRTAIFARVNEGAADPTHGGQDGCGRGGSPDDVRERATCQRFQREPGPTGLQRPICSAAAWGRQRGAGALALKHPPRAPCALLLSVRMMTSASHGGIHRFARSVQTTLGLSHSNSWCVSCHSARPRASACLPPLSLGGN